MPKGTRLSQKSFNLIKEWQAQGFSTKKIIDMLPDEIRCSHTTISKVAAATDYDEYCGIKKEPEEPKKQVSIVPFAQLEPVIEELKKANILAESQVQAQLEAIAECKALNATFKELSAKADDILTELRKLNESWG